MLFRSQGGAGATGVGQRLAPSERAEQNAAGRRAAVRPSCRMGSGRGNADAHSGGQSGAPLRLCKIGVISPSALPARFDRTISVVARDSDRPGWQGRCRGCAHPLSTAHNRNATHCWLKSNPQRSRSHVRMLSTFWPGLNELAMSPVRSTSLSPSTLKKRV